MFDDALDFFSHVGAPLRGLLKVVTFSIAYSGGNVEQDFQDLRDLQDEKKMGFTVARGPVPRERSVA